ncbi:hypothetical protein HMPREF1869_01046 [Bacteroidales bacterium KA00251]|nr:hypothetical protein HMPREF1869_01046 [Bacteroidales bacterium KA00251]
MNQKKQPALVIMAAGMGNRYGGLKQLDPLGPSGETIMDYSVFNAINAGFGKIVFVIRASFESDFRKQVLSKYCERIHCEVVFQEVDALPEPFVAPKDRVRPWGTGHALLMARTAIEEPFCVINADDFYGKEAFALMAKALSSLPDKSCGEYCTVCYTLGNTLSESGTVSRGICSLNSDNTLNQVVEYKKLLRRGDEVVDEETGRTFPLNTPVSMNFWGFTPDYFEYSRGLFQDFLKAHLHEEKSEFYIPTVVSSLITTGKASIEVMQSRESWFGVTYAEDRPIVVERLTQLHAEKVYPTPLFSPLDK